MARIIGINQANLPWQAKATNYNGPVWRHTNNPIIKRDALPNSNSIFNSAVVPFGDGFAGVFRCDDKARSCALHVGFSHDAVNWKIESEPIKFISDMPFEYGYDPRVVFIEDRYYVTWCNGYCNEPTIGVAETKDFKNFYQYENAFLPFNRNGVLFPRKINGKFVMLSRPSDPGHTPFGDIYLSHSPDMHYWGDHRLVMKKGRGWEATKIGAGPIPIETTEGWLMIYHGVLTSCGGMTYSCGAALLDLEEPHKVIKRSKRYLFSPFEQYETTGDTPNVVFPCSALTDAATNRIAIYYGCADTCTSLAYTTLDEILDYMI